MPSQARQHIVDMVTMGVVPPKAYQKAKRRSRAIRPQMVIDIRRDWREVSDDIPRGCDVIGVISIGDGPPGVL